jgi:hypothetical protein
VTQERPRAKNRRLIEKTITVPGNLRQACEQFNSRHYFDCHETLEEIWHEEDGELREFYKGLIQLAAAFVHVSRGNAAGADRLLRTSMGYLIQYRESGALGFDVDALAKAGERCHDRIRALGTGGIAQFHLQDAPTWGFDAALLAADARRWGAWGFGPDGAALEMTITVVE